MCQAWSKSCLWVPAHPQPHTNKTSQSSHSCYHSVHWAREDTGNLWVTLKNLLWQLILSWKLECEEISQFVVGNKRWRRGWGVKFGQMWKFEGTWPVREENV